VCIEGLATDVINWHRHGRVADRNSEGRTSVLMLSSESRHESPTLSCPDLHTQMCFKLSSGSFWHSSDSSEQIRPVSLLPSQGSATTEGRERIDSVKVGRAVVNYVWEKLWFMMCGGCYGVCYNRPTGQRLVMLWCYCSWLAVEWIHIVSGWYSLAGVV